MSSKAKQIVDHLLEEDGYEGRRGQDGKLIDPARDGERAGRRDNMAMAGPRTQIRQMGSKLKAAELAHTINKAGGLARAMGSQVNIFRHAPTPEL